MLQDLLTSMAEKERKYSIMSALLGYFAKKYGKDHRYFVSKEELEKLDGGKIAIDQDESGFTVEHVERQIQITDEERKLLQEIKAGKKTVVPLQ